MINWKKSKIPTEYHGKLPLGPLRTYENSPLCPTWHCRPALTSLLQLITPGRASGTADHVRSLDDLLLFWRCWAFWAHWSCPDAPVTFSSTAPTHPHATRVAVYPAMLFLLTHRKFKSQVYFFREKKVLLCSSLVVKISSYFSSTFFKTIFLPMLKRNGTIANQNINDRIKKFKYCYSFD